MTEVKEVLLKIRTPICRGAFLNLWEPRKPRDAAGNVKEDADPEFTLEGIFDWDNLSQEERNKTYGPIQAEVRKAILNKWGKTPPTKEVEVLKEDGTTTTKTVSAIVNPLKIASKVTFKKYDARPEIHGKLVINFKAKKLERAPQIAKYMGKGNKPKLLSKANPEEKRLIYPGAFYIVTTKSFAWEQSGNCGVSFGLGNVIKMKDGTPLGAAMTTIDQDFGDMPEDYGIEVDNSAEFDDSSAPTSTTEWGDLGL